MKLGAPVKNLAHYQTLSKERSRQFQTSIRPVALCSNVQYLKQIPADLFGQDFQDLRRLSPTAGVGISNIEQGTSNVEVCLTALMAVGQLKERSQSAGPWPETLDTKP